MSIQGKEEILRSVAESLAKLDMEAVSKAVQRAIQTGLPPHEIIEKGLMKGLEVVGENYEKREYFLSELLMSAEIANHVMKSLEVHLKTEERRTQGKVVLGTVQGDLHDIGKNLVAALLRASGFEVHDIGVDAPPKKFVEKIKEAKPNIVGMSALLTVALPMLEETVKTIEAAGLRKGVRIIVGGRAVSSEFAKRIGVDAYCKDAWEGVKRTIEFVSG